MFVFLYGVSGSVFSVYGCASMLVSVTFYVGMRGDCTSLTALCGERDFARRREQSFKCFLFRV